MAVSARFFHSKIIQFLFVISKCFVGGYFENIYVFQPSPNFEIKKKCLIKIHVTIFAILTIFKHTVQWQ